MQLVEVVQDTLPRPAMPLSMLALGAMDQLVPFQTSAMAAWTFDEGSTVPPTATQSLASAHETPKSSLVTLATFGLGTADQVDPFQVSTRVWFTTDDASTEFPTATQSLTAGHVTSWSLLFPDAGLGLGTTDQVAPFQTSLNVESTMAGLSEYPTATQLEALVHETAWRTFLASTLGLGMTDQLVPFQFSIKVESEVKGVVS
jgi:hypothetical protein